ncbi:hypothetical protein AT864_02158 [Anoxybacillus sp. P3H1B]|nr:hypothetical protein AT864_02158 [Anoxybacillus sp. P3H1B]MBB3909192.1 hypothetical protein [Anoxybacillus rupiensis]OQM44582.1 hypothetical protein B6A27_15765 [Anoxybacillus sp. UARK-01]
MIFGSLDYRAEMGRYVSRSIRSRYINASKKETNDLWKSGDRKRICEFAFVTHLCDEGLRTLLSVLHPAAETARPHIHDAPATLISSFFNGRVL